MAVSAMLRNTLRQPLFLRKTLVSFQRCFIEQRKIDINGQDATDGTIANVRQNLTKLMGISVGYSPLQPSREHLLKLLPVSQDELPPRSMQDSFSSTILPLSSDLELQEKYVTFLGHVRLGRLMEDMDRFAAWIVCKHLLNPKMKEGDILPYTLVTVLVDKIDFTDYVPKSLGYPAWTLVSQKIVWLSEGSGYGALQLPIIILTTQLTSMATGDIRLSGHVSWVGNSTMEVVVWLEQKDQNTWQKITRALFLMAARNSLNTRAAFVNRLIPATEHEKKILEGGEGNGKHYNQQNTHVSYHLPHIKQLSMQHLISTNLLIHEIARKKRRQQVQKHSLIKMVPTVEEQQIIHDVFTKTIDANHYLSSRRNLPHGAVWMESSEISNLIYSHPEDRNYHNKVFGGFLMRHALELSWSSALLFGKQRPRLMHISDILFHQPVDVNSIIKMFSNVIYTEHNMMQIAVHAEVYSPEINEIVTTNEFHYTYQINDKCKLVMPRTYHEAMQYLNGRRNFQRVMHLTEQTA